MESLFEKIGEAFAKFGNDFVNTLKWTFNREDEVEKIEEKADAFLDNNDPEAQAQLEDVLNFKIRCLKNVVINSDNLTQHKIAMLRDKNTNTAEFRRLLKEITFSLGLMAFTDLDTQIDVIETPITDTACEVLAGKKPHIVPILRAGFGMLDPLLELVPSARVGMVGIYRDEETSKPNVYYCKFPGKLDERLNVIIDPMLATGGSAIEAVNLVKEHGGKRITFVCVIAAPEGIQALAKAHPDVKIIIGHVDRCLNEKKYIVPGLGDAGDRIFGTR